MVGGEITKFEKKTTKKGDPFANLKLVYGLNEWSVKFWKEALQEYEPILSLGNTIWWRARRTSGMTSSQS